MSLLSALTNAVTFAISAPTIVPVNPPEVVIVVVPAEKSIPSTSCITLLPACVDEESVPSSARTPVSGSISPNNNPPSSNSMFPNEAPPPALLLSLIISEPASVPLVSVPSKRIAPKSLKSPSKIICSFCSEYVSKVFLESNPTIKDSSSSSRTIVLPFNSSMRKSPASVDEPSVPSKRT